VSVVKALWNNVKVKLDWLGAILADKLDELIGVNQYISCRLVDGCEDIGLPEYQTKGSAGLDLKANVVEPKVINPGEILVVKTGLVVSMGRGIEAQVRARSGLASKYGISCANGVGTIDSDFTGEIGVILINFGDKPFKINRGDRIAQLVFANYMRVKLNITGVIENTERGDGGYGHTGK